MVREAAVHVYTHEGADWYEDRLHDIAFGKLDPRYGSAVIMGLRLRGRLK